MSAADIKENEGCVMPFFLTAAVIEKCPGARFAGHVDHSLATVGAA